MDDVQITVLVPPERRRSFKRACLNLHTTMSVVLRNAIDETIVRDALTPAAMGKGDGDG